MYIASKHLIVCRVNLQPISLSLVVFLCQGRGEEGKLQQRGGKDLCKVIFCFQYTHVITPKVKKANERCMLSCVVITI